jgi:hypothetical protein
LLVWHGNFQSSVYLKTANEAWLNLHELHDCTSNVREQKHCLVLNEYNYFAMKKMSLLDICILA